MKKARVSVDFYYAEGKLQEALGELDVRLGRTSNPAYSVLGWTATVPATAKEYEK